MTSRACSLPRLWPLRAALICCGLGLVACSTTPQATHFHTLMARSAPAGSGAAPASPGPAWELLPVGIPGQVDRPQLVVQLADGSLAVIEQERWIAPLADEFHAALAERLTQALGVPAPPAGTPRREAWRVRIDVRRLDSAPGRYARLEVDWGLRSSEQAGRALRCHASHEQAVEPGYAALAAGHREALARLAEAIAASLRALEAGRLPECANAAS